MRPYAFWWNGFMFWLTLCPSRKVERIPTGAPMEVSARTLKARVRT